MRRRLSLLAFLLACLAPARARASFGTEFWFAPPESQAAATQPIGIVVSNPNAVAADITLEDPSGILFADTIPPGAMTVLRTVATQLSGTDRGIIGMRLTASAPVSALLSNPDADQPAGTRGVTALLPVTQLGTRHRAVTYRGASRILVVALEDNTTLQLTPTADVTAGFIPASPAGTPIDVVLSRLEAVQFATDTPLGDFTGSLITSTAPVAVFSGGTCVQVPDGMGSCDHLLEQDPPVSIWGTEIVAPKLPDESVLAEIRRIVADQPDTHVSVRPVPSLDVTLQPGDVFEFASETDVVVTADNPIAVASLGPEVPSMLIHAPTRLHGTTLAFGVDAEDTATTVVITAPLAAIVSLDGMPIAPGAWTPIAGTAWQRAWSLAPPGYHVIRSDIRVGALVFGGSSAAAHSYVVPGADVAPIPLTCDAGGPYVAGCDGETITLDGSGSTGDPPLTYAWVALSSGVTFADPSAAVTQATLTGAGPWSVQLTVTSGLESKQCVAAITLGADTTPPAIGCPGTIVVNATSIGQASVPVIATATDSCDPAPVLANDRTAGGSDASDVYRCGETLVTFTATDAAGNRETCMTRVIVTDAAAPEELSPRGAAIPLRVRKSPLVPNALELTHATPLAATTAVNVYRGTIPARAALTYDHAPIVCAGTPVESSPGVVSWTLPMDAGVSRYYLVSGSNCVGEGSRGVRSDGAQRPALPTDCGAVR